MIPSIQLSQTRHKPFRILHDKNNSYDEQAGPLLGEQIKSGCLEIQPLQIPQTP